MPRPVHRRIPYDSHPLYALRRNTLIAATTGVFLHSNVILYISQSYRGQERLPLFVVSAFLLAASIAFVSYDLVTYATREAVSLASHPSTDAGVESAIPLAATAEERPWPSKARVICDFVMAVVLLWLFVVAVAEISSARFYDWYGRSETVEACK